MTNFPVDAEGNILVAQAGVSPFRFVGISSQRFDGGAGWAAMTRVCFDEYGGRIAFEEEYALTLNPTDVPEKSWIARSIPQDKGSSLPNCDGWSNSGASGSIVSITGVFSVTGCGVPLPVACAAQ